MQTSVIIKGHDQKNWPGLNNWGFVIVESELFGRTRQSAGRCKPPNSRAGEIQNR